MARTGFIAASLLGCTATAVSAGAIPWIIEPGQGSVTAFTSTTSGSSGTLIGDWDEEANPDGTQTRPGFFGGSGNVPISLAINQGLEGAGSFPVVGGFDLNIDIGLQLVAISDLQLESGAGSSLPLDNTLGMNYETFRSINPDSLYVGGIEIPIPLGSGELTSWSFSQKALAGGPLIEGESSGSWTFALPMVLTVTASGTLDGAPFGLPSTLLPVVLIGTYLDGDDPVLQMEFSELLEANQVFDPPLPLPDVPLELPTIVPPGSFAGVLLSLAAESAGFSLGADAIVTARPDVVDVPGDANGDGTVTVDDLLVVISSWGACTGCAGDLDGDGQVGVNDLLIVLQYWGT